MTKAVFAIPGDMHRKTGGFIYEATVLRQLNTLGCETAHLQLPAGFPDPSLDDMNRTMAALRAVLPQQPIILDGLVFGAIDPEGLATVPAPVIAMIHHPLGLETGLTPAWAAFLKTNEAAALRYAAHVIVPSPHTAQILIDDFGADPDQITIAQPGFDRPKVAPAKQSPPLIISVGLLAPRKGHDVLLSALALINDLPWQAQIIGKAHDPDYATALVEQCAGLDLNGRVQFMGELDGTALNARFNAASVFALATRYEGYGMVLSEAMQYGLPIVSCATGAVPETVGPAGVLVPADDAKRFAEALRSVLTDPRETRRLAALSSERANGLPVWRDTAERFVQVIDSLKE